MYCRMLDDGQIKKVHEASLRILQKTGVIIPHKEMLILFSDAGATVDFKTESVRIPPELVESCLTTAGKSYTLYGRDLSQKKTAGFGLGKRNYNSIAGEASWVERPGLQRRYASINDVVTAARLGDALDCINIVGAMADPHEIPTSYRCVEVMATLLKNTSKPITFWFHDRASARYLVDIVIALRGSIEAAERYPVCYPFLEPISPLRFPSHGVDLLFETARINMPVPIGPMAQTGLTAPGTLAGTMAIENAEILAGICITQLIRSGMPVCYGGICHAFDMRTTQLIFSGPEQAIFGVSMTQLGKSYGLPVYINVGLTDAKRPDAQAGLEAGVTIALGAAAGADIFGHMGISGVDQGSSLQMLILQNEVISYVESVMREVDLSDDAFGFDAIEEVGPGGSFIGCEHTAANFRKELWFPRLLDRQYYEAWLNGGAKSMEDRCTLAVEDILANHTSEPPGADLSAALDDIVASARAHLAN